MSLPAPSTSSLGSVRSALFYHILYFSWASLHEYAVGATFLLLVALYVSGSSLVFGSEGLGEEGLSVTYTRPENKSDIRDEVVLKLAAARVRTGLGVDGEGA